MWLGISGVGFIVLLSGYLLLSGLPLEWLPCAKAWSATDLGALLALFGGLIGLMFPLDFLGGFLLPNRTRPNTITVASFAKSWVRGVTVQAVFFFLASLLILAMGRSLGLLGASFAVLGIAFVLVSLQLHISMLIASLPESVVDSSDSNVLVAAALQSTAEWGWKPRSIRFLASDDSGFTGGIVGLPGMECVILPAAYLKTLTPEQLTVTIARRLEALQSGSRTRGMLLAFAWVITGFVLSAMLPSAGVTSVGELAMTCCGFTLWTFLGLLTLPTLSRQASYAVDQKVMDQGASAQAFFGTLKALDVLQDDEPKRSALIETIFHPVPSVENRRGESASRFPIAWHAARMTLFVSWACMGMLVRAVHCNVGRPELWVMLPTD